MRRAIFLLLLLAGTAYADTPPEEAAEALPFAAAARLSQSELAVGDETVLHIGVPDGEAPASEARLEQLPEGWSAKRVEVSQEKNEIAVHLAPFDLKLQSLEAVRVSYQDAAGQRVVLETAPQPVAIRKLTGEQETHLRDIRGPQTVKLTWWKYLLYALGGVVLLWLALHYGRRLRRGEKSAPQAPAAPPVPPHERALAALAALEAEDLPGKGEIARCCTRLSEILREYLEGRYEFLALEQTTEEIRSAMLGVRELPGAPRDEALALLQEWDLVKFADVPMSAERARETLRRTRAWVEATRPAPVTAEPAVSAAVQEAL